MKITQDECRLMCDELAQCKGFLFKHDYYTATELSCTLNYNKCGNASNAKELGTYSFEKQIMQGSTRIVRHGLFVQITS